MKRSRREKEEENIISLFERDLVEVQNLPKDAIVTSLTIVKYDVERLLVDSRSLADILFYNNFVQMNFSNNQLNRVSIPLVSFSRKSARVKEKIKISITTRTPP